MAHAILGQHEDAERDYSMAIELQPDRYRAYFHRGELYFRLSRQNDARLDLDKALDLAQEAGDNEMVRETRSLLEQFR